MDLRIDLSSVGRYTSLSQRARHSTESWAHTNLRCPSCNGPLDRYTHNRPVADLYCTSCTEDFELKATSKKLGPSVPDGAYSTMLSRLSSRTNPNLFLLHVDSAGSMVRNLWVIPKYYFCRSLIQKRRPLASTARRAGWTGCNILVGNVPKAGRISIVCEGVQVPLSEVVSQWAKTKFLKNQDDQSKSWMIQTMRCIDLLDSPQFQLSELYAFESMLQSSFPNNRHIKEKLRQQLQVLRDHDYLKFLGSGHYQLTSPS